MIEQFVVLDANTGEVLADGFATISDALDASELLDPDESRGVFATRRRSASERPHRAEIDPWQTDPADRDYLTPEKRWCRVCLRHPDHSMHSAERRASGI